MSIGQDTHPAIPFLSFATPAMCVTCGRLIQQGERAELLCGGPRVLPCISWDGESQTVNDQPYEATFELVHRECPT